MNGTANPEDSRMLPIEYRGDGARGITESGQEKNLALRRRKRPHEYFDIISNGKFVFDVDDNGQGIGAATLADSKNVVIIIGVRGKNIIKANHRHNLGAKRRLRCVKHRRYR